MTGACRLLLACLALLLVGLHRAGASGGGDSGFPCPPYRPSTPELRAQFRSALYANYTRACDRHGDNWNDLRLKDHETMARKVFTVLKVVPGQAILDWGCGCGFKLRYGAQHFSIRGLGLDAVPQSVEYAASHMPPGSRLAFCAGDGSNLTWLADDTFDHTITTGALHHLYLPEEPQRTEPVFCATWMDLFRVTRPGGWVLASSNLWRPPRQVYLNCWRRLVARYGPQDRPKFYNDWDFWDHKAGAAYWSPATLNRKNRDAVYTVLQRVQKPARGG